MRAEVWRGPRPKGRGKQRRLLSGALTRTLPGLCSQWPSMGPPSSRPPLLILGLAPASRGDLAVQRPRGLGPTQARSLPTCGPASCLLLFGGLPCFLPSPFSQGLLELPEREKVGPVSPGAKTETAHPTRLVRAGSGKSPRCPQKQGLWGRVGASWRCPLPWPAGGQSADKSPPGGGQVGSISWARPEELGQGQGAGDRHWAHAHAWAIRAAGSEEALPSGPVSTFCSWRAKTLPCWAHPLDPRSGPHRRVGS